MNILAHINPAEINYWAVGVAALLTFFLGGLWYSPALFESTWIVANDYDEAQVSQVQARLGPAVFGMTIIAYFAMAMVFAVLMSIFRVQDVGGGLLIGLLLWLGFVAPAGLTSVLFSPHPVAGWLLDTVFHLVFLLMTGCILGLWRP